MTAAQGEDNLTFLQVPEIDVTSVGHVEKRMRAVVGHANGHEIAVLGETAFLVVSEREREQERTREREKRHATQHSRRGYCREC